MPATSDRILRAPASRVEPKVFINPDLGDPGSLDQVAGDLRSLLRESKKARKELGAENTKAHRLAHSLSPFLRQHSALVEQHAQVLKLIDERAGEASAIYKMLAERADRIDSFESRYDERMTAMRDLLSTAESRLTEAHGAVGRIEGQLDAHCKSTCERINTQIDEAQSRVNGLEEQSSQAITRLRREFDAHMIRAADEANSRVEASSDQLESLDQSARLSASRLHSSLEDSINEARKSIGEFSTELDAEVKGARVCMNEAIIETREVTDQLYADLDRQCADATLAANEIEDALESSQEAARSLTNETQTRIDNTMRLGRLKLDELCNAFTTWIEAGQTSIDQAVKQSSAQLDDMTETIENETTKGLGRLGAARDESVKEIEATCINASSRFEDAERAMGEVVASVRTELSAFDTAMFARIDQAKDRIVGIVDQEAQRAESLRAGVGNDLDQRLADLTEQCDRAQTILLGDNGPDTTGLLAMLEKAESLEHAVEAADERASFATRQLESIREQANQVRKTLSRALLLAADATDKADAKAAMLDTALEQARTVADAIAGSGSKDCEGAD